MENKDMTATKMANRIREMRKANGLTLSELGSKLGVNDSAVSKWESGKVKNIPRNTIDTMAKLFDCSPSWLMGYDNNIPDYVPGTVEVIDLYSKATPEQRKAVLNLLRSFVSD